ncbi:MAG: DUF423 domain-containing protein [Burkholderiales bacterium]
MPAIVRLFLALGASFAALGVVLGAFGAHALKARLSPEALAIYHTAVQYQIWHGLGLLAVGLVGFQIPQNAWLKAAGWLLAAGIFLFSGSLYLLAAAGIRWLGPVTPVGGAALILGWLALVLAVSRA